MDVVEVKGQMEVVRVGCQQIEEDLFDSISVKRAEGLKELGCQGRIKDIGVDMLLDESEKILAAVPAPAAIFTFAG